MGVLRAGLIEFRDLYADYDTVKQLTDTYVQEGEQQAFTEAAFITPPQALRELRHAGFAVVKRAGVEGFAPGALTQVAGIAELNPPSVRDDQPPRRQDVRTPRVSRRHRAPPRRRSLPEVEAHPSSFGVNAG